MDSHNLSSARPSGPTDATAAARRGIEDTPERRAAKVLAQRRLEAMRKRTRRIRRAVGALAAAMFSAAFLTVYVQLASGHDPALTAAAKRSAAVSTGSAKAKHASSASSAPSSSSSTPSSSTEASSSSTPSSSTEASSSSAGASTSTSESSAPSSSSSESSSSPSAVTTKQS
jgi:hypothetical protein